jgi:RNA polymerase sigma-70 factor (ECF subfamily)
MPSQAIFITNPIQSPLEIPLLRMIPFSRPVEEAASMDDHALNLRRELENLYPRVYRAVIGITAGSGLDADDLTQDAFLKAYHHLDSFRGECSLYTWIYRIARNVCLDAMRRKKFRNAFKVDTLFNGGSSPEFEDPSHHDPFEQKDTRYWIDKAMARLPEDHRSVLVFREIQDLSYEEIAYIMNIPEGTVKSRLFKARRLMRETLQQFGIQP